MNLSLRPRVAALAASLLLLSACATTPRSANAPAGAQPDCTQPQVQRLLTYCASPEAASQAEDQARVRQALARGDAQDQWLAVPTEGSPVRGPAQAPVTVVMFADLECPYCAMAYATLTELQEANPETLRLVFKHAPLTSHANAVPAAATAIALGEQGKFWEFVDQLYALEGRMDQAAILAAITAVGADSERMKQALESASPERIIERDLALAEKLGVEGTPTFFINGVRVVGAREPDMFGEIIQTQVARAAELTAAGVPLDEVYWRLTNDQYAPPEEPETGEAPPEEAGPQVSMVPVGASPVRGADAENALVTIAVFSDFQCPFCARVNPALEQVMAKWGDRVRVVFKHLPLPFHDRAPHAAAASLVAHDQGKFWAMHDRIFANQKALSDDELAEHAKAVGVTVTDFSQAMRHADVNARIEADVRLAQELGLQGTPTLYVNGIQLMGAQPYEALASLIEQQLEHAGALREASGKSGEELYEMLVDYNEQ